MKGPVQIPGFEGFRQDNARRLTWVAFIWGRADEDDGHLAKMLVDFRYSGGARASEQPYVRSDQIGRMGDPMVDEAFAGRGTYIENFPLAIDRRGFIE